MASKRKGLSKKIRFEVFKRDGFTCQYCGQMAPDVVLHVDHINPVANGGDNDIMNLITSCVDCNLGKGKKELSDNQIIKKQQEQLKELNEKREQLEMMLAWKKGLSSIEEDQVRAVEEIFHEATELYFSKYGRETVRKQIQRYGMNTMIDAVTASVRQYYKEKDEASAEKAYSYIGRIAYTMQRSKSDPFLYKKNLIRCIVRDRLGIYNQARLAKLLNSECTDDESCEVLISFAREANSWSGFWCLVQEYFREDY